MSALAEDVTNVYQLRAELDGETRIESVYGDARNMPEKIVPLMVHEGAEEWEVADADASMSSIARILNLAAGDDEDARIWAKGEITLTNVKTGRVVTTMPAKEV